MKKIRKVIWVTSFSIIFLFIPSLGVKIWDYLLGASWQVKSWLFSIMVALTIFFLARRRWRKKFAVKSNIPEEASLLFMAKERLAKGEISLAEFREIRQELKEI